MNDTPQTPSRFPTFAGFFRRCFRALFSRKALYVLIAFITVVVLFYAIENFRGRRAWIKYRQEAEARGMKLDFKEFIPPQIPDSENGASTPTIQSWFPKLKPDETNWFAFYGKAASRISSRKPDAKRHMTDLVAWKEAFDSLRTNAPSSDSKKVSDRDRTSAERTAAAPTVLEALSIYDPIFNEFRAASRKPNVRYPINYLVDEPYMILLPHLAKMKSLAQASTLRASANLAVGNTDAALDDVLLAMWAGDSIRDENFLICQLVRVACLQIALQPIWEGLAEHRWTDAQLKILHDRLAQIDLLPAMIKGFNVERAGGVTVIDAIGRRPNAFEVFNGEFGKGGGVGKVFAFLYPSGWRYMEMRNLCLIFDAQETGVVDVERRLINAKRADQNNAEMEATMKSTPIEAFFKHHIFAKLLLPAINKFTRRVSAAQVQLDEARIACVIERYRLVNGKLPESLDALVPDFAAKLPHDVLSGAPFKYEKAGNDQFTLTSVGWKESNTNETRFPENYANKLPRTPEWTWQSAP